MTPNDNHMDERYIDMMYRHRRFLWYRCLRHAYGDDALARELYQMTLHAVWAHLPKLAADATADQERRWLKAQARSVASHHRRRKRLATVPLDNALADTLADHDAAQRRRDSELLDELSAFLPDDDRRLLRLYRDGFVPDEIAQILSISRDTVYQRLHRAVQQMKSVNNKLNKRQI